jgi:hypothetical protein
MFKTWVYYLDYLKYTIIDFLDIIYRPVFT